MASQEENLLKLIQSRDTATLGAILESDPNLLYIPLDKEGNTIIHLAATSSYLDLLEFIGSGSLAITCDVEININKQNSGGFTPLHEAAKHGKSSSVQLLLSSGADPNCQDGHGRTVVHWAAENCDESLACLIVSSEKYKRSTADLFGRTALHWAAKKGLLQLTHLILENKNVDIDAKTNAGETPLMWACLEGCTKVADLLIQLGADPTVKNNNNQSLLDIAPSSEMRNLISSAIDKYENNNNAEKSSITNNVTEADSSAATVLVKDISKTKSTKQPPKKLKITLKK